MSKLVLVDLVQLRFLVINQARLMMLPIVVVKHSAVVDMFLVIIKKYLF
jgi:hypothetical protein